MDTEVFTILTRVGQGHRETTISIDWNGISIEELKVLARATLVKGLQDRMRAGEFSDTVRIIARQQVFYKQAQGQKREWPKAWTSGTDKPVKQKRSPDDPLLKLLQLLTPEEQLALLG